MKQPQPQALTPLACTLTQFRTILYPCSRATANSLVQSGELESFTDRGRRMVLIEKVREFVARKAARGGAVPPEVSEQKSRAGKLGRAVQLAAADRDSEAAS
jgi:hypothetical protein